MKGNAPMVTEPKKPKQKPPLPIRIPDKMKEEIRQLASDRGQSLNAFICDAIKEKVERVQQEAKPSTIPMELAGRFDEVLLRLDAQAAERPTQQTGILAAHVEDLRASINRLEASLSAHKLTREEILESLTFLAKYGPRLEGEFEGFFSKLSGSFDLQKQSIERFIDEIDSSTDTVNRSMSGWENFINGIQEADKTIGYWQQKNSENLENYRAASDQMEVFRNNLIELTHETSASIKKDFVRNFTRYYGLGFGLFLLALAIIFGIHYSDVLTPNPEKFLEICRQLSQKRG